MLLPVGGMAVAEINKVDDFQSGTSESAFQER
jgi:hypothetical protein